MANQVPNETNAQFLEKELLQRNMQAYDCLQLLCDCQLGAIKFSDLYRFDLSENSEIRNAIQSLEKWFESNANQGDKDCTVQSLRLKFICDNKALTIFNEMQKLAAESPFGNTEKAKVKKIWEDVNMFARTVKSDMTLFTAKYNCILDVFNLNTVLNDFSIVRTVQHQNALIYFALTIKDNIRKDSELFFIDFINELYFLERNYEMSID